MTHVFKRFDLYDTDGIQAHNAYESSEGEYVLAQDAYDREAVNSAEIQTLKAEIKSLKATIASQLLPVNLFATFQKAMKVETGWAWSWHCSVACVMMDHCAANHETANKAAAIFMQNAFGIDTKEFPEYKSFGYSEE